MRVIMREFRPRMEKAARGQHPEGEIKRISLENEDEKEPRARKVLKRNYCFYLYTHVKMAAHMRFELSLIIALCQYTKCFPRIHVGGAAAYPCMILIKSSYKFML